MRDAALFNAGPRGVPVPKAKCPTCANIVTYAAGYDPICPRCGFRGAAPNPPAPVAAAWANVPGGQRPGPAPVAAPATGAPGTPVATAPTQGIAVAALVVGLVGFLFPPLSIVAIVLGAIGMNSADRNPRENGGKGMAIAGLVLGLIVAVFWLVILGSFGFWDW